MWFLGGLILGILAGAGGGGFIVYRYYRSIGDELERAKAVLGKNL